VHTLGCALPHASPSPPPSARAWLQVVDEKELQQQATDSIAAQDAQMDDKALEVHTWVGTGGELVSL